MTQNFKKKENLACSVSDRNSTEVVPCPALSCPQMCEHIYEMFAESSRWGQQKLRAIYLNR